ncbi:MAG TPA: hypothetical protein PK402_03585 [Tepidisphaeraceae bacterium]|nr:hypothetical protein [Tepidisphaeraceae bacterium]
MKLIRLKSLVVGASMLIASSSCALADPKLDDVLKSVSGSINKPTDMSKVIGLVLACAGLVGVLVAIRYMQQKSDPTRPLHNHRRLMREISSRTGLSKRTLRALEPMAKVEGISNPIVVMLCPSALKNLSQKVKTPAQREALLEAARKIARTDFSKGSIGTSPIGHSPDTSNTPNKKAA